MTINEADLDRLPHRCYEGVWPVPCDDRCPLRDEGDDDDRSA